MRVSDVLAPMARLTRRHWLGLAVVSATRGPSSGWAEMPTFVGTRSEAEARATGVAPAAANPQPVPDRFSQLATAIVREQIPPEYVDTRDWGETTDRWAGLHVHLDGWELRTKRRRKTVPHGTWKRYEIRQIDPEQNLHVTIGPVRSEPDGRTAFLVTLDARIHATTQWVVWNRGVRVVSVTVEADSDVRLWLDVRLAVSMDLSRIPPGILLAPEVVDGDLQLRNFTLQRVSHLDGPLVREAGDVLERIVRQQIDNKRPELIAKINRQIERHRDDLRFSAEDLWRESWGPTVAKMLDPTP